MARLYDQILRDDKLNSKSLAESELIIADNVLNYITKISNKNDWFLNKDIPVLLPPFENIFIETRNISPPFSIGALNDKKEELFSIKPTAWGANMLSANFKKEGEAIDVEQKNDGRTFFKIADRDYGIFEYNKKEIKYQYFININLYIKSQNKIKKVDETCNLLVNEKGEYIHLLEGVETARFQEMMIFPLFLAISFMHCKNVEYVENDYPTAYQKKYKKRHGKPMKKYKTLKIEPMKKTLQTKGNISKNGLKKALHICRGHFKDYRENGLFGKHHEIYWWDSHVRGSKEVGEVEKDYKISI